MSTSISRFSQAAEQAQAWVNDLAEDLDWDEQRACRLLKSVLQALRDWLSPQEAADLAAQLPVLLRGMFFEGWSPSPSPRWERTKHDFILRVREGYGYGQDLDPDRAIRAVFKLLDSHVSQGEIGQVRNGMRKPLRELWPAH